MQIQAYQFIKYNNNTLVEHIKKASNTGAIICFDFEDGIINPLKMEMSALLKEEAREQFIRLYSKINDSYKNIKVGIRINNNHSSDFNKDLIALSGKSFDSIFIPKIQQSKDIHLILDKLNEYKIEYKNLIPIIESKTGFENLENILQSYQNLTKIAFGHCDYNLNIGAYPFFHQDSWQYWKWVAVLLSKADRYGVQLLNSAFLNFGDETFFCAMLDYIAAQKNRFHGQFTLTTRQSELCSYRPLQKVNFRKLIESKNLLSADKQLALALVYEYEINNKIKGLTKSKNRFISLQEYIASKNLTEDDRYVNELCFLGGCFPVQWDIVYEDLFHQKLRQKIEENYNNKLNINIIRYERFSTVLDKIISLAGLRKLDLIVFHIRPEPFLRLTKLIYKYIDNKGRLRWSLNLPYINLINPEKYDMLDLNRLFHVNVKQRKSLFDKFLVSFNYLFGTIVGNKRYALKNYYLTTKKIIDFCHTNNIKYIILGPNRRSNNYFEPSLCRDLDLYISNKIDKQNYICGFLNDTTQKMNQENGIHVTQAYHDLIANRLYETIVNEKLFSPTRIKKHKKESAKLEQH